MKLISDPKILEQFRSDYNASNVVVPSVETIQQPTQLKLVTDPEILKLFNQPAQATQSQVRAIDNQIPAQTQSQVRAVDNRIAVNNSLPQGNDFGDQLTQDPLLLQQGLNPQLENVAGGKGIHPTQTFVEQGLKNYPAAKAGVAGFGAGVKVPGPLPVKVLVGLGAGGLAAFLTDKATDTAIETASPELSNYLDKSEKENPLAAFTGEVFSGLGITNFIKAGGKGVQDLVTNSSAVQKFLSTDFGQRLFSGAIGFGAGFGLGEDPKEGETKPDRITQAGVNALVGFLAPHSSKTDSSLFSAGQKLGEKIFKGDLDNLSKHIYKGGLFDANGEPIDKNYTGDKFNALGTPVKGENGDGLTPAQRNAEVLARKETEGFKNSILSQGGGKYQSVGAAANHNNELVEVAKEAQKIGIEVPDTIYLTMLRDSMLEVRTTLQQNLATSKQGTPEYAKVQDDMKTLDKALEDVQLSVAKSDKSLDDALHIVLSGKDANNRTKLMTTKLLLERNITKIFNDVDGAVDANTSNNAVGQSIFTALRDNYNKQKAEYNASYGSDRSKFEGGVGNETTDITKSKLYSLLGKDKAEEFIKLNGGAKLDSDKVTYKPNTSLAAYDLPRKDLEQVESFFAVLPNQGGNTNTFRKEVNSYIKKIKDSGLMSKDGKIASLNTEQLDTLRKEANDHFPSSLSNPLTPAQKRAKAIIISKLDEIENKVLDTPATDDATRLNLLTQKLSRELFKRTKARYNEYELVDEIVSAKHGLSGNDSITISEVLPKYNKANIEEKVGVLSALSYTPEGREVSKQIAANQAQTLFQEIVRQGANVENRITPTSVKRGLKTNSKDGSVNFIEEQTITVRGTHGQERKLHLKYGEMQLNYALAIDSSSTTLYNRFGKGGEPTPEFAKALGIAAKKIELTVEMAAWYDTLDKIFKGENSATARRLLQNKVGQDDPLLGFFSSASNVLQNPSNVVGILNLSKLIVKQLSGHRKKELSELESRGKSIFNLQKALVEEPEVKFTKTDDSSTQKGKSK